MTFPSLRSWRSWIATLPQDVDRLGALLNAGTIAHSKGVVHERPRIFGHWAWVYLVAGEGIYSDVRGTRQHVSAGDWILVFPEIGHTYGPSPGGLWHEVYICFDGILFESWREGGHFDPRHPTGRWLEPREGIARLSAFFQQIARKDCSSLEAVCLWQLILADVFRAQSPSLPPHAAWLSKALESIDRAVSSQNLDLPSIAGECGMGYESFRKKFREAIGQSPGRYALERRIERARQLLQMSRMTNREIADLLGFHDEFHFSRAFSQMTGLSPRDYRRRNAETDHSRSDAAPQRTTFETPC